MGERKGTNKYYPPDYNPNAGGLNKFLGVHALRERGRKAHLGIIIIRFEMPYNIWCDGCGNHIGMGVRYNAEKKKVGMYYSTPVYEFRMKCHLCDNHFLIVTDPGNLDYVIKSGARRQENRWDPNDNGQIVPDDKATTKRLFDDAMFKLEHGETDRASAATKLGTRMCRLLDRNDSTWKDDFSANSALRAQFRAQKKELKAKMSKGETLSNRYNLSLSMEPEHEDDINMATLLSLRPAISAAEKQKQDRQKALRLPVVPEMSSLTRQDIGVTGPSASSSRSASNSLKDDNSNLGHHRGGNTDNVQRQDVSITSSSVEPLAKKPKLTTLVCADYNSSSSSSDC